MTAQRVKISSLLETLAPKDQEELSLLQLLLRCALSIHRGISLEKRMSAVSSLKQETTAFDLPGMLALIPEESKRYLHGLVEAMEVYHSIYGHALPVQALTLSDKSFHELRQIRDLCLDAGLRSFY